MRIASATFAVLLAILGITPAHAQSEPFGAQVLEAVTVTITSTNYTSLKGATCHGATYAVTRSVAYVITAKHCVSMVSSVPLEPGIQWRDIRELVNVRFPNGATGREMGIYWPQNYDALVMRTALSPFGSRRPVGYLQVCRCGYYRTFPRNSRIPVYSMLSAGGGRPVPSSGFVVTDANGIYRVFLPSAHGTSGTMIVDEQGRLVGLVYGVFSQVGAGYASAIAPAPVIVNLLKYAFDRDGVAYTSP
jgi:hypothetical protein